MNELAPTRECMDSVYADAGYNRMAAARACSGGVSIECMNAVYADAGYNKASAANACGGR